MSTQPLTQKYAIVHLTNNLADGYEFSMTDWPLHVTVADVFSIKSNGKDLITDLHIHLCSTKPFTTNVIGEEWFGQSHDVHVKLLLKTSELQVLHNKTLAVLDKHGAVFNNPEFTNAGFKPHFTIGNYDDHMFEKDVTINSVSLIDMFPNKNPYQRRVIGTVDFLVFN